MSTLLFVELALAPVSNARAMAPAEAEAPAEAMAPAEAETTAPVEVPAPSEAPPPEQEDADAPTQGLTPPQAPASARPDAIDLPPPASERTTDQAPDRMNRGAEALIGVGVASLVVGAATLLVVSWPAWGLHNRARDQARDAQLRSETSEFADMAARRRRVAVVALGIGASLSAAGVAMLTGGVIGRRRDRRLSVAPAVGGGFAGASAQLRF